MLAWVKYLFDYRTDNCNPVCLGVCYEASDDMRSVSAFFYRAHGLLKNHRIPQQLCCFILMALVGYQSRSIIAMIVSQEYPGDNGFLLCTQRTFCIKPKGIILVESTEIRWFLRLSSGGGWSGRASSSTEAKILKTRVKGAVRLLLQRDSTQGSQTGGQ
jgi:hypothetical protein